MIFIIRLFPEITIKSDSIRKRWTRMLAQNLRILSRRVHEKAIVEQDWDRIMVKLPTAQNPDAEELLVANMEAVLATTPGIANFSKVTETAFESIDDIYQCAFQTWQHLVVDKTFCVRARRVGKHAFGSMDVERYVGGGLNQNTSTKGVNLKNPDITLSLEIKENLCYIVEEKKEGLGGFPMGTQEGVMSLMSGGFDSTVASYLMMKRGMRTHFCFFSLGGKEHERGVKEIAFYLWNKYASTHKVRFITVPFEDVVAEILEKVDSGHMGVVLKRMMLRAAEKIADKGGIQALVTGEAIAQVSSQTVRNLAAIDRVTNNLVLRPLITTSKPDIINTCREIGAEKYSANIPEYCGVISVKPSAGVKLATLEAQEAHFNYDILNTAIAAANVQSIDQVMEEHDEKTHHILVAQDAPTNAVIIDVRSDDEKDLRPLVLPDNPILNIPFYQLNSKVADLDTATPHLLYCEKGVVSQLHAAHLHDAGHTFIGVYRPNKKKEAKEKRTINNRA